MAFVDGEPLDAAKLGQLETKLNIIESKIPTFGNSNQTISINNSSTSTTQVVSQSPKILVGTSDTITIESAKMSKRISFKESFSTIPTVVACIRGGESQRIISIRVASTEASGFTVAIASPPEAYGDKNKSTLKINYIAVAY